MVMVTAGSPRACGVKFRDEVLDRSHESDSINLYRLVRGKDVVASVPPKSLGFRHLGAPIAIGRDGVVTWPDGNQQGAQEVDDDDDDDEEAVNASQLKKLAGARGAMEDTTEEDNSEDSEEQKLDKKYNKMVGKIPGPLRDHMPDCYLNPLLHAKGRKCGSMREL